MSGRQRLAALPLLLWMLLLGMIAGPIRWEFAHTYSHWIAGVEDALPTPTRLIGLPLLDLGETNLLTLLTTGLCWGIVWGGPVALLAGIRRTSSREGLLEWLLYGGSLYAVLLLAVATAAAFSLWLPFSLL